jgi:hypothetical protein
MDARSLTFKKTSVEPGEDKQKRPQSCFVETGYKCSVVPADMQQPVYFGVHYLVTAVSHREDRRSTAGPSTGRTWSLDAVTCHQQILALVAIIVQRAKKDCGSTLCGSRSSLERINYQLRCRQVLN